MLSWCCLNVRYYILNEIMMSFWSNLRARLHCACSIVMPEYDDDCKLWTERNTWITILFNMLYSHTISADSPSRLVTLTNICTPFYCKLVPLHIIIKTNMKDCFSIKKIHAYHFIKHTVRQIFLIESRSTGLPSIHLKTWHGAHLFQNGKFETYP